MTPNDPQLFDQLFDERLERYLTGSASAEDHACIRGWVGNSETRARQLRVFEQAMAERRSLAADVDMDLAWQRLTEKRRQSQPPASDRDMASRLGHGRRTHRIWLMAASACLLVAIGVSLATLHMPRHGESIAETFTAAPGQQVSLRLANDVRVVLAPQTTLRVTSDALLLEGEAYFTVTPHPQSPITIRTGNTEVRVLGTAFSVRRYPGEVTSRVVVEEGKVSLRATRQMAHGDAPTVASARTLAIVSDSGVVLTSDVAPNAYLGWVKGELSFKDVPLADVVAELARAYGTSIRVQDSVLSAQPVTFAASVRTEPLMPLLELVGRVAGARVVRDGNALVLVPGRTSAPDARLQRFPQPEKSYGR